MQKFWVASGLTGLNPTITEVEAEICNDEEPRCYWNVPAGQAVGIYGRTHQSQLFLTREAAIEYALSYLEHSKKVIEQQIQVVLAQK